jgi:hypothetical protein
VAELERHRTFNRGVPFLSTTPKTREMPCFLGYSSPSRLSAVHLYKLV